MIQILDHGLIKLVDNPWGSDKLVCDSARVSVEGGVRTGEPSEIRDKKLIKFLAKSGHTSPFEHCGASFYIKLPFFVARQWHRHRTQSYNEVSGRYSSEVYSDFYLPTIDRLMTEQSQDDRQGIGKIEDSDLAQQCQNLMKISNTNALAYYKSLVSSGVSKELARTVLPVSTYTEMYASANLWNWIKFIKLRSQQDAQYEIRVYSNAIKDVLFEHFPVSMDAWFPKEKK
jgi:thymidylate synthase (FAD)